MKTSSYVSYKWLMEFNMSNPIVAIYLNAFGLGQNIELMATWVHFLTYLLFVTNLSLFKLFTTESGVFRMASVKHTDLKSQDKEIHFSL